MPRPGDFYVYSPNVSDYWRAIVLFGRNAASYKFALAKSLLELKPDPGQIVSLEDLAEPFSRHVCEHLKVADRQATSRSSRFLDACRQFNAGDLTKEVLVQRTVALGFQNVIDAFHVVNQGEVQGRFFVDERASKAGIRITDEFQRLVTGSDCGELQAEAEARWKLVETAWDLRIAGSLLAIDYDHERRQLVARARRVSLTSCRPALSGYQKGCCFYCFRLLGSSAGDADIDHFFPRVLLGADPGLHIDGIWNLVVACRECNRGPQGKFTRIPSVKFLERLSMRNEYLIWSHHPLRETLMGQSGSSQAERSSFLKGVNRYSLSQLLHQWEPESVASDPYFAR